MLITEEKIEGGMFTSPIYEQYFQGMEAVVADIETTGLSPKYCHTIVGGAVCGDGSGGRLATQFFAASGAEEAELLERYGKLLTGHRIIVTYNGHGFDIPFLIKRMKKHGLDTEPLENMYSLDMYRVLRKYSHLPEILPDMKQKSVEEYLGDADSRRDVIDGGQSVRMYQDFQRSSGPRREELLDNILLHNRDDIVRLSDMMRIIRQLDFHKVMFNEGFPLETGNSVILTEKLKLKGSGLTAEGRIAGPERGHHSFLEGAEFFSDERNGRFKLQVECREVQGLQVVDTDALGLDEELFEGVNGYESGYLVLSGAEDVNYREANLLVRSLLLKLLA